MATIYNNILITKLDTKKKQAVRLQVDVTKIQEWKVEKQCVRTRSNFSWL